ncbi:hypothetical protein VPH35_111878 [Triticum aestivum]
MCGVAAAALQLWWHIHTVHQPGERCEPTQHQVLLVRVASEANAKIERHGWIQPRINYVKLNVDGAFDPDLLQGSYGVVIRDSSGKFIAAGNGKIEWCGDALMAEAMALRFGLNLATTVGCNRIEVNSDNVEVIEAMKNGGQSFGIAAAIFDDSYHIACDFPHIILSIFLGSQTVLPMI